MREATACSETRRRDEGKPLRVGRGGASRRQSAVLECGRDLSKVSGTATPSHPKEARPRRLNPSQAAQKAWKARAGTGLRVRGRGGRGPRRALDGLGAGPRGRSGRLRTWLGLGRSRRGPPWGRAWGRARANCPHHVLDPGPRRPLLRRWCVALATRGGGGGRQRSGLNH